MVYRLITIQVVKTVHYVRDVTVRVEETAERLKDAKRWPEVFEADAADAAVEKASTLTGWEMDGIAEYQVADKHLVAEPKNVDVTV